MQQIFVQYIPYIALLIACLFAVFTDIRSRKIPNAIPLALVASALIFRAFHGPAEFLTALATIVGILFVGVIAFSFRWLGGGDIKLLAAGCAFLPLCECTYFLLFTAIGGGFLAIVTSSLKGTLKQTLYSSLYLIKGTLTHPTAETIATTQQTQLPYAIAITLGALCLTLMHTFDPTGLRVF